MPDSISIFAEAARQYCDLLDSLANGKPDGFYRTLHRALSRLAVGANELPRGDDHENKSIRAMTHDDWGQMMRQINHAIGADVADLIVQDGDNIEAATRVFMLSDCLADIYRELRDGLSHYKQGGLGVEKAAWDWRFFYEHHWGLHLFDAMHTVHRIRLQLYAE